MNAFDLAVGLAAVVAVVFGFRAGLVRSLATILGYLCAAPFAVKATALISQAFDAGLSSGQTSLVFFCTFAVFGVAISAGFCAAIDELSGVEIGLPDRLAGSALGVVRVGLIAVTLVLVFDRIIPAGPRSRIPRRIAVAADLFARRTKRVEVAATRNRSLHRSDQGPPARLDRTADRSLRPCDGPFLAAQVALLHPPPLRVTMTSRNAAQKQKTPRTEEGQVQWRCAVQFSTTTRM
jgi:membrane protein required for colicin V production